MPTPSWACAARGLSSAGTPGHRSTAHGVGASPKERAGGTLGSRRRNRLRFAKTPWRRTWCECGNDTSAASLPPARGTAEEVVRIEDQVGVATGVRPPPVRGQGDGAAGTRPSRPAGVGGWHRGAPRGRLHRVRDGRAAAFSRPSQISAATTSPGGLIPRGIRHHRGIRAGMVRYHASIVHPRAWSVARSGPLAGVPRLGAQM